MSDPWGNRRLTIRLGMWAALGWPLLLALAMFFVAALLEAVR